MTQMATFEGAGVDGAVTHRSTECMKAAWNSFSLAWSFLTIIPLPWSNLGEVNPVRLASSFRWYPFVGLLLGTFLVLSDRVFSVVLAEPVVNLSFGHVIGGGDRWTASRWISRYD